MSDDPGLADERTALAWTRTAVGLLAVAAFMLRFARVEPVPAVGEIVAACATILAVLTWWQGRRSYGTTPRVAAPLRSLSVAVTVVALAATAVVAVGLAI